MYQVKCDECKETIRETEDVRESYAGGTCYPCVLNRTNKASARFRLVQEAYRRREIGDTEYLAGRKEFETAERAFDLAFAEASK